LAHSNTYITTEAGNRILDFLFGGEALTPSPAYYVALSSTPINPDGTGITEPTDEAYERIAITNNKTNFTNAAGKTLTFANGFSFPTSEDDWGLMTHFAIFDDKGLFLFGELRENPDGTKGIPVDVASTVVLEASTNYIRFDVCDEHSDSTSITEAASNKALDFLFGGMTFTLPATYYLGVSSTPINPNGTGISEPTTSDYGRIVIPNDKESFANAIDRNVTFAKELRSPTSQVAWGRMTHYFLSDAPTGGNIWFVGELLYPRNVQIATTLVAKPDEFIWKLNDCE